MSEATKQLNVRLSADLWDRIDRAHHMGMIESKQGWISQVLSQAVGTVEESFRENTDVAHGG